MCTTSPRATRINTQGDKDQKELLGGKATTSVVGEAKDDFVGDCGVGCDVHRRSSDRFGLTWWRSPGNGVSTGPACGGSNGRRLKRVGVSAGGDLTHQPAALRGRQLGLQCRADQLIPQQPDHLRAFAAFACLVLGGRQRFLLLTVPATQNLLPGSHSASSHAHTNDRQGRLVLRRHVQRNRWPTQHEKPTTT